MSEGHDYLVIALYEDNLQRYAQTFRADSPQQAEELANLKALEDGGNTLLIAAVLLDGKIVA